MYRGDTLEKAWKEYDNLRREMIEGKYPYRCKRCWKTEESLGSSRRHWMFEKIQNKLNHTSILLKSK